MASDLSTHAPHSVRPVMRHTWADLTFIHWPYRPEQLRPLVARSLEIDTFDGRAWVGLTPFLLSVRPPALSLPLLPGLSRVPETNLRTYVRDGRGRHGIWFFSLDISRLAVAVLARATYWLPYRWAEMTVARTRNEVRYIGSRKPPERAAYRLEIEPESRELPVEGRDELVDFLTARWRLYTLIIGKLMQARVQHQPWPLVKATVVELEQTLTQAAGLPAPHGEPLAHFSSGVDVSVGPPVPV